MTEKKYVEEEVCELENKDHPFSFDQMSHDQIAELVKANPALQRYIDRKVSQGISTFCHNQKKKQKGENGQEISGDDGASEIEKENPSGEKELPPELLLEIDALKKAAREAEEIKKRISLEKLLAQKGLSAFAGLIDDAAMIEDLELAIYEFMKKQNMGIDYLPARSMSHKSELSAFEVEIAKKLGIEPGEYEKQKQELIRKEGIS